MNLPNLNMTSDFVSGKILSFQEFIDQNESQQPKSPAYTGRYLITLKPGVKDFKEVKSVLKRKSGFKNIASSMDFRTSMINETDLAGADVIVYDDLGIALLGGDTDQLSAYESNNGHTFIEPELIAAIPNDINQNMTATSTWGLSITMASNSPYSGKGVKIAVLDTGFDTSHPDYAGRTIITENFVENEAFHDGHGHGTHCIGTACGHKDINGLRYGVAYESDVYACRVLNNNGTGAQMWIINAMRWAVDQGCKVISMSLGSPVYSGQGYNQAYEAAAKYCMSKGTIVVAAAGNESDRRYSSFKPIGSPADCPSVLAIGAIDENFNLGFFSNRAFNPGTKMALVAPGVNVYSSWPMNQRYKTIMGTSMATPHVAGIIGLICPKIPIRDT